MRAESIVGRHGITMVQARFGNVPCSIRRDRQSAKRRCFFGYGGASGLTAMIKTWTGPISLTPEIIIADHAPTALIARLLGIPRATIGAGFFAAALAERLAAMPAAK